ncbi:MAG: DUF2585 family protein [Candidatus Sungbacteria bacterium]|nr:DUF2585 family protein [Candidatus Sungbacteria bacterium]
MKRSLWKYMLMLAAIIIIAAAILFLMGRTPFGPTGEIGFWTGDVHSQYNSQRFADPYSFTHIAHGVGLYLILLFFFRRLPAGAILLLAVLLEVGWEILENTEYIIERYRAIAIARGYFGDSILNSVGDILFAAFGAFLSIKFPKWALAAAFIFLEIFLALTIRDNLTLNIIQLIYPIPAIESWQLGLS